MKTPLETLITNLETLADTGSPDFNEGIETALKTAKVCLGMEKSVLKSFYSSGCNDGVTFAHNKGPQPDNETFFNSYFEKQ